MGVFQNLSEEIQKAISKLGINFPSPIQEKGIPEVLAGKNVLLIAPTGTGKTEAGVLPVLHKILVEKSQPIACIYITPLRSLNRDMLRRLQTLCQMLELKVAVRHGDTSQHERAKQAVSPAHLLITTPETFQILFLGKKLRNWLKNVRYIIIDEIHELFSSERGYQLSIALERLEKICGKSPQRIGLSASVGNPEEVAKFLVGCFRECSIVDCGIEKEISINVSFPRVTQEDEKLASEHLEAEDIAVMRAIAQSVSQHKGTIVFVNTRAAAEFLALHMHNLFPSLQIAVHHGSLAKEVRIECEDLFKAGKLNALIATSSLELGIDIGHVDFVIQYNSPRQVGRLLQRVGRSGHGLGRVSQGVIFCSDPLEALEAFVLARRAIEGKIEKEKARECSLSVLANQIVAHAIAEKSFDLEEFYEIVKRAYPFRNLEHEQYLAVVKALEKFHRIFINENRIEGSRRGREYFYTNISMIPDERTYKVVDLTTRRIIAQVDESFVVEKLEPGVEFAVKGSVWQVEAINEETVFVLPSQRIASPPSWQGEEIPVPFECALEVGEILRKGEIERLPEGIREGVKEMLCEVLPLDNALFVCMEGRNCMLLAPFGSKVNETLARAISIMLSAKLGESVNFSSKPYWILFELPRVVEFEEIERVIKRLPTNAIGLRHVLEKGMSGVSYFRWIFVNVAKKFGLIERDADYSQINIERFIEEHKESIVYAEAIEKTIFEHMDIENTIAVLESIAKGNIALRYVPSIKGFAANALSKTQGFVQTEFSAQMIKSVKERLLDTEMVLICMACGSMVYGMVRSIQRLSCLRCGSIMIAGLRKGEKGIIEACKKYFGAKKDLSVLSKGEKRNLEKAWLSANLVRDNGRNALLALAGRGVGPDTAARILSRGYESEEELISEVIKAEIKYAQTKKYWR